jgi:dienelactone hydrolase
MATEACCTPAPPATPTHVGREETLGGARAYVTGSPTASASVILISDIFGVDAPLLRKLADKVAASGYLVAVPDVLQGDPFAGNFAAGDFGPWVAKHPPKGAALEIARGTVAAVRATGIESVGVAGMCWGAKVVAYLMKSKDIRAAVQLHPAMLEPSDYEEVAVPIAVLASPTDGIEKYEAILASRTSFVKVFPDVKHGWSVRYDETDPVAVEKANEAHQLALEWFAKYL